jgi:hypothetical protein
MNKMKWMGVLIVSLLVVSLRAGEQTDLAFADPANTVKAPAWAVGQADRKPDLDALPGFTNPPKGFGNVAFYWWLGDKLTKEKLTWQMDQLKDHSTSSLQINYAHDDRGGKSWGFSLPSEPALFSEAWWDLTGWFMKEAQKRGMSVSLSDYTLGFGQGWYVDDILAKYPDVTGYSLAASTRPAKGNPFTAKIEAKTLSVCGYNAATRQLLDLRGQVKEGLLSWNVPEGAWALVTVTPQPHDLSLDPMNPQSGKGMIEMFFGEFERRNPGQSGKGLNFFFSDELVFGVKGNLWNAWVAETFKKQKGYDVIPELPALFMDIGPRTAKVRLDYYDVLVRLQEMNYFKPIFDWHQERGMIYGCDHGGRGRKVVEFGDYFRTQRWNQGPGSDQPKLEKDITKAKVAASIAHLYNRPRVWLEGFHSSGWATTSEEVADAIFYNYTAGYNLLSFHGLYYSTKGGWWEWAPPCNHFHMPYWTHMKPLMKCVERLSYLMSQGHHCADVAVLYPVAAMEAYGKEGRAAVDAAFRTGGALYAKGMDLDYMDFESLARATLSDKQLKVSGERYRALVLPSMKAMRWSTLEKAAAFQKAGGLVIVVGDLPEATDRAGAADPEVDKFAAQLTTRVKQASDVPALVEKAFPRDYQGEGIVNHRRIGPRDVYMIYDASKGSTATFHATGKVELWNPWDGTAQPLEVVEQTGTQTTLMLPLDKKAPQLVVFSPGQATLKKADAPAEEITALPVDSAAWGFELKPSLDNQYGDFHWPATPALIGAEARLFRYAGSESGPAAREGMIQSGFGPKLWVLGPLPKGFQAAELPAMTAADPAKPVDFNGKKYAWKPYAFSWRWGKQGDPGHQGYHGLKGNVTDAFLCLGKPTGGKNETVYGAEEEGTLYYVWTTVPVQAQTTAYPSVGGGLTPDALWVNGQKATAAEAVTLKPGANPVLARYTKPGRGYLVMTTRQPPRPEATEEKRDTKGRPVFEEKPLAMQWWKNPDVLPFDPYPQLQQPVGTYTFLSPPGLRELVIDDAQGTVARVTVGDSSTSRVNADVKAMKWGPATSQRFVVDKPSPEPQTVTVVVKQQRGAYAGAALPEYIRLQCGEGRFDLGNWSRNDALSCYSGGAWYRKEIAVPAAKKVVLNLGEVSSTAEVFVDGKSAGVRIMQPWTFDMTSLVKTGASNKIEVLVYSAMGNHYRTIPTRYRRPNKSGLIGPVTLEVTE